MALERLRLTCTPLKVASSFSSTARVSSSMRKEIIFRPVRPVSLVGRRGQCCSPGRRGLAVTRTAEVSNQIVKKKRKKTGGKIERRVRVARAGFVAMDLNHLPTAYEAVALPNELACKREPVERCLPGAPLGSRVRGTAIRSGHWSSRSS